MTTKKPTRSQKSEINRAKHMADREKLIAGWAAKSEAKLTAKLKRQLEYIEANRVRQVAAEQRRRALADLGLTPVSAVSRLRRVK